MRCSSRCVACLRFLCPCCCISVIPNAVDKLAKDGCEDEGREIIRRQILGAGFESGTISLNAINAEVFLGYIRIRHHDFICLPNLEVIAAITGRLGIPEEVLLPAKTPLRYPDSFAKFGNQADQAQGRGTKMFWVGKQFCCGDDLQRAAILERLSEPEKSELVKVLARQ